MAIAGRGNGSWSESRQEERIAIRRASEYQKQLGDLYPQGPGAPGS